MEVEYRVDKQKNKPATVTQSPEEIEQRLP